MSNRWYINKVGLLNFWYYDEEEFTFSDGKLLLRGSNGSGKSVTMQSFVPLLLDGNKSPERLDPFGSRARKLENYLLSDEEREREERTAYLYMEFKKKSSSNYLTIGMGFKAQRGKQLNSWGFAITDGRRIGHDFYLYKDIGNKIPLTKKELENRIGSGGMVKDRQKEYMKMVNDLLFGFDEMEEYDELIKLLIQLRSPKLSKEFKPTVVYEILENSLQQLSEDDLRPMSEAIENMDNIKARLEELKESKKAAGKIQNIYDKYNEFILVNKAKSYLTSLKEYDGLLAERKTLEQKQNKARVEFKNASNEVEELKILERITKEKKSQLDVHDSLKIKEKIYNLDKQIESTEKEKDRREKQLDEKKGRERDLYSKIKDQSTNIDFQRKEILELLEKMDQISLEFAFDEHNLMKVEVKEDINKSYDFSYTQNSLKEYQEKLNKAKNTLEQQELQNNAHDESLLALSKAREEVSSREKLVEESELQLDENKEELIEKIYAWKKDNQELIVDDDILVTISRKILNFREESSYDDVISTLRDVFNQKQDILNKEMANIDFKIERLEEDKKKTEELLEEWRNKKEIEPERTEKAVAHRKLLNEKNIPFVPFYKAIDFKDSIPNELRGILEEALWDMGLLDALIIPDKYKKDAFLMEPNMGDKYILSSPSLLTHSLGEFFQIEKIERSEISYIDLENVLKSIFLDEENGPVYVNENGEYGIGILRGKTSSEHIPKYIGSTARERTRREKIQLLDSQLLDINDSIQELAEQREVIDKRLDILQRELRNFPSDEDLKVAINYLKNAKFDLKRSKIGLEEKKEVEQKLYSKLKELNRKVTLITQRINLTANLDIYNDALYAASEYKELLYSLINKNIIIVQNIAMVEGLKDENDNLVIDIENLLGDIEELERKNKEETNTKISLEEQLNLTDYKEIEKEIDHCIKLLDEIPRSLEKENKREATEKAIYEQTVEILEDLNDKILLKKRTLEITEDIFSQEFKLKYCNLKDLEDTYKNANNATREIKNIDKQDKESLTEHLFSKFSENNQYLREYILRIEGIFQDDENKNDESSEHMEIISRRKRLYIKGKIRGKDIDFYELLDFIIDGIEENERLLKESDRQLFEDVLVNTISKKIRAKIYHSQKWVNRMNQLMENMNTSSGLSFKLSWTSKKAESEGQLDTKELVELLKLEGSLMKESDLNKLSEHFRSKISEARRIQEDLGKRQSFHSIMREILDYRKWFEFKLNYTKVGQNRKELTNNAFYQFSGGEKAMAMYVPLFSAVYARYEGGRPDCPRLISLDEAFAGVDEKNIRDMFRLLDELNLDYMLNSQILWGDYDTVPSLSISELLRPDNANYITVLRYHWNGKVKEFIT